MLGKRVRELRQRQRIYDERTPQGRIMTQVDLAAAIQVVPSYICHIETGRTKMPTQEVLTALAKALNTTTDDLLTAAGYRPEPEQSPVIEVPAESIAALVSTLPPDHQKKILRIYEMIVEDQGERKARESA